jgi:lipoprotein-anchoring transpeptidase ErfK/SrfK
MVASRSANVAGTSLLALSIAACLGISVHAYGLAAILSAKQKQPKSRQRVASKSEILESKQLLSELGYWLGPLNGKMDAASRSALIAFQKLERREITGRLTDQELEALRHANRPKPRETGYAHIEVDLTRQVLLVIGEDSAVTRILPVSSGNGKEFTSEDWTRQAVTPTGRFKVHRKLDGWRKSPLGLMYYPIYYLSGVAIHGAKSVPTYPASHGCIRIPMFAAQELNEMTPIGTVVLVYAGDNSANDSARQPL